MATHSIDLLRLYALINRPQSKQRHSVSRQTITAFLADVLLEKGPSEYRGELESHRAFMRQIYADGKTEKSGFRNKKSSPSTITRST